VPGAFLAIVESESSNVVLLYDGECTFCRRWVARWAERTGDRVRFVPFQEAGALAEGIPTADLEGAVHRLEQGRVVARGAAAVFSLPGMDVTVAARLYRGLPAFRRIADAVYAWIARHRIAASWGTRMLWGAEVGRPRWAIGSSLFLRCRFFADFCGKFHWAISSPPRWNRMLIR